MPSEGPTLAVIVNTFNQPEYLARVLASLGRQLSARDEVLVADDGSGEETRKVFEEWHCRSGARGSHVWQPHEGFRRSRILNAAIARARAEYLIFLDGDSLPHSRFLEDHRAAARDRAYIQGHRVCLGKNISAQFGRDGSLAGRWRALVRQEIESGGKYLFRWPMAVIRSRTDLRGVRGCNLAIWRKDLVAVNGYNEAFEGWGREDSELAQRLINSGVAWLDLRGRAICYHLWHPPADRSRLDQNIKLLEETCSENRTRCERGLDQHLPR